ncbi:MAG TPA: acyl-CoA synthetase FdrA [Alphaproteobacteria bacterium]|nr:acyl-CoA synthetase FdrA [Alphaproteobacteria bacterium]
MANLTRVIRNFYRDSVSLMQLSARIAKMPGVTQASAVMATENNLALLREAGLLDRAAAAGPNDLLVALAGESEEALAAAAAAGEAMLTENAARARGGAGEIREPPRSLEMALKELPAANLALISTPGEYAAAEALKALKLGLNVMLFSDNVALADEVMLKRYAARHDLLVMGPDCGTAIIGGIPLGFANVVRRGGIGVVAASGTGLQQVTCLIDRHGMGISQAIGTGGHDLHAEVGGITMQQGIAALAADPATKVIVLISKPPAPAVAEAVLASARRAGKPVVVNFLGADPATLAGANLTAAKTLEDAADAAVALARGEARVVQAEVSSATAAPPPPLPSQRFIRALYSGGTFCYEASLLLGEVLAPVFSNTPVGAARELEDVWRSRAHTLVDLGDDLFTRGRPHPMIDQRLRNERLLKEAADPEVAVVLLDVVLGYGSHPDPAGEIAPVVREALKEAAKGGRKLAVVGFVCGTAGDPQGLARQEEALRNAGMELSTSNAQAVRLAARIVGAADAAGALGDTPRSAKRLLP